MFEIAPRPLPWAQLLVMNVVHVLCGVACAFVILPRFDLATSGVAVAFVAAVVLVASGVTAIAYVWSHLRERRKGPWLIYDRNLERVRLLRQQVEFSREDLRQIEEVITRSLRNPSRHLISELNVVANTASGRGRWNLLRSDAADGAFCHVLIHMRRCGLPVVRLRGSLSDWRVRRIHFDATSKDY